MATNERNTLSAAAVAGEQKYANFVITSRDNMDIIRMDRADKKNAISLQVGECCMTYFCVSDTDSCRDVDNYCVYCHCRCMRILSKSLRNLLKMAMP
jgi:hypothetical protein